MKKTFQTNANGNEAYARCHEKNTNIKIREYRRLNG